MVAYRRYPRRMRRRRKVAWYNKKYSAGQLAVKAWRATRYLKGLVNSEMFHNEITTSASINNTGTVYSLTNISQGDSTTTRTGNSILVRNLLKRIRFTKNASATTTFVRCVLFQDKQQVGDTSPAITDLLASATVDAPLNLNTLGRFKILYNKTIVLNTNSPQWHKESYHKMYTHVRYNGTAGTDIQKGGLYIMFISDQPTNAPTLDMWLRLGYHDN